MPVEGGGTPTILGTDSPQGESKADPPFNRPVGTGAGPSALSQDSIFKTAQQQISSELQGQIDPLQNQIGTLGTQENRAVGQIGSMFDKLQPTVNQGVVAVSDSYNQAQITENSIFTQAQANINQLKQNRAAEAQQMAQNIGGPVAVGEFTAGFDPAAQALTYLGAGQQLHTLGYAQAGVQEASAFASQVFPLLRTEETAKARNYFEDQIKTLRENINDLNKSKTTLTNTRYNELKQQQLQHNLDQARLNLDKLNNKRTYGLQVKQYHADQIKANRDWNASKRTLNLDERRVTLAEKGFATQEADITGKYKGKPTLAAKALTAKDKATMATLDITKQQLTLRKEELAKSSALAQKKLAADQKVTWAAYVDAAVDPKAGKSIPVSHTVAIDQIQAYKDPKNSWYDKKTGKYYHTITTHETAPSDPITSPQGLYEYLLAHGVGKGFAVTAVKNRLGVTWWKPGMKSQSEVAGAISDALPG